MIHPLSAFLLSTTSNVDVLAVATAYGVKKVKIGTWSNILIAVVSTGGTVLSMAVGASISRYLPGVVANFLGSAVLIAIGLCGIWDTLERERKRTRSKSTRKKMTRELVAAGVYSPDFFQETAQGTSLSSQDYSEKPLADLIEDFSYESFLENPEKADKDRSGHLDVKESISLAFGLTINNLGGGVGAGISGLNIVFTAVLTFVFSILAVVGGYFLGDRLTANMTSIWTGIISGLMIVGLGIYEYFIP